MKLEVGNIYYDVDLECELIKIGVTEVKVKYKEFHPYIENPDGTVSILKDVFVKCIEEGQRRRNIARSKSKFGLKIF